MASNLTTRVVVVFIMALLLSTWIFNSVEVFPSSGDIESSAVITHGTERAAISNTTTLRRAAHFPLIIHTMWKNPNSPPPAETMRWKKVKKGCRAVNPTHDFRLYYDADLLDFVRRSYPEYLALFLSLKGVYMADMARVLMIYHYGGIYMDLDFYCHRPFTCIVDRLLPQTDAWRDEKDVLIVSLEPAMHANIFRNKDRVVIQDFYMSTARHPFFKWFLDDRLTKFDQNPGHPAKGPFSYSIEVDIDAYKKSMIVKAASDRRHLLSMNESSSTRTLSSHPRRRTDAVPSNGFPGGYIHELPEHVLHPLVDSTNPRLNSVCNPCKSLKGAEAEAAIIPPWAVQSCEKVRAKKYFSPSKFTIAVHMWTHTFLGWSFFRGLYNSGVYAQVERELIPTMQCPAQLYV